MSTAPRPLAAPSFAALSLATLSLATLALPPTAQARGLRASAPIHGPARMSATEARSRAVDAASAGFAARMGRLDALMGASPGVQRTRSANAEP